MCELTSAKVNGYGVEEQATINPTWWLLCRFIDAPPPTCLSYGHTYRIAVETLLKNGFKPVRGIVIAFGTDEERGGYHVRSLGCRWGLI